MPSLSRSPTEGSCSKAYNTVNQIFETDGHQRSSTVPAYVWTVLPLLKSPDRSDHLELILRLCAPPLQSAHDTAARKRSDHLRWKVERYNGQIAAKHVDHLHGQIEA